MIKTDAMGRETENTSKDRKGNILSSTETSYDFMGRAIQTKVTSDGVTQTESADGTDTVTETSYGYEDAQIHTLNGTKDYQDLSIQTTKTNGHVSEKSWTDAAGQTVRSFSHGLYTDHVFTNDGKEIATISLGTKTSGDVKNTKTGEDQTYAYDAENRLSQVSVTKDGKTAVIQQNIYNGEGQRIQKIDGDETINYYYQDGVVAYTTDTNGNQNSQNLIGTDGNVLATERFQQNATQYYLYNKDIQGSTSSLVKEDGSADAIYHSIRILEKQ